MMPVEQIRAFVAIELNRELLDRLAELQERLQRQVPPHSVRWVRPEGIHLTLQFLGDIAASRVAEISRALETASRDVGPFPFQLKGLGCFPNLRRVRVVWVGIEETTGVLQRLQKAVGHNLAALGYPPEERPFSPHLTLGRVQRSASLSDQQRLGEVIVNSQVETLGRMTADAVYLMRSDLRPTGAVYSALARLPLAKDRYPTASRSAEPSVGR
jgi:2'-5' RNA ligase